jgi:hypothetical protein
MLRLATLAALLLTTPAFAQDAPVGIFRCHDTTMSPYGTLILSQGTYQMIGTSTPDWLADPKLPQNGAGGYDISGTKVLPLGGPLKTLLDATGNFLGSGMEATIGFANSKGTVLTCLPTVGG